MTDNEHNYEYDPSDPLCDLPNVGPKTAENLREAGYTSKRDVLESDAETLAGDVFGIGRISARSIVGDEIPRQGEVTKFYDIREELLDAADSYLNMTQVAAAGGVERRTLYRYLDRHEEFHREFKRRRASGARKLIEDALDPDKEVDVQMAKFLLERSFKFIKIERRDLRVAGEDAMSEEFDVPPAFLGEIED